MQPNKIFYGVLKSDFRKALVKYVNQNKGKFNYFVHPTVGSFSAVEALVKAGIKPPNHICGDISIYSALLGYYLANKDFSELKINGKNLHKFKLDTDENGFISFGDKEETIAKLFLAMKYYSLKDNIFYYQLLKREILYNLDLFVTQIKSNLKEMKKSLSGIKYENMDMLKLINQYEDDEKALIFLDPPSYQPKAYKKMFGENAIEWRQPEAEFLGYKELKEYFKKWKSTNATMLLFVRVKKDKTLDDLNLGEWDKLLVVETGGANHGAREYLLVNRSVPAPIGAKSRIKAFEKGFNYPIITIDDLKKVTKKSKIGAILLNKEQGDYYRNLFVHRLKEDTPADFIVALTIDGKIFGIAGLVMRDMAYGDIFINYAIVITLDFPKLYKLLHMVITAKFFIKWMERYYQLHAFEVERIREIAYSYTKNDKKLNGVMKKVKITNERNMYKIMYEAEPHNKTIKQILDEWLKEVERYERAKRKNK